MPGRRTRIQRSLGRMSAACGLVLIAGLARAETTSSSCINLGEWELVDGSHISIPGLGHGTWTSVDDDGKVRVRIRKSGATIKMNSSGEITPNDDDTDITDVESGGHFELEERRFGRASHKIQVFRNSSGTLERRYWVGRKQKPFDEEGRTWLAATLPLIYRNTTVAVPARVRRLLTKGGATAVLAEVDQVTSDHVARAYYSELLKQSAMGPDGVQKLVEHAGTHLDSDYELAQLLVGAMEDGKATEGLAIACAKATGSLDSDYERGRVLKAVADRDPPSAAVMQEVLVAARGMESDYETAQLLVRVAKRFPVDAASTPEFFAVIETMESSYEARRVLSQVVENGKRSPETARAVLAGAMVLDSDYERAELLRALARDENWDLSREAAQAYIAAAADLGSDYERGRAFTALLKRNQLDSATVQAIIESTASMSSDYERAGILIQAAERYSKVPEVRNALRQAAEDMDSDHERQRVLAALGRTGL